MLSCKRFAFLFDSYSNDEMKIWIVGSRRSWAQLKWAWYGTKLELLALIASNKNERLFCKKLDVMIRATNLQLLKYVVKTIIFAEIKTYTTSEEDWKKNLWMNKKNL
jgi:hypothetical protein